MKILDKHIKDRKKIGEYNGQPVELLQTYGGYNIVASAKNGDMVPMGVGPNSSIAKFVAQKKFPDMQISELSKSLHEPYNWEEWADKLEKALKSL